MNNIEPVEQQCVNCKAFKQHDSNSWGRCRAFPPAVVVFAEQLITCWPNVASDDWCSRWQYAHGNNA